MFRISCFADEISPDFDKQLEFLEKNDIKFVELRSIWDKNVLDLNEQELDDVKNKLNHHGIKISSIGSPIGKIDINDILNYI